MSNPDAVQHLGGRDTPQAGINAIERDGSLLYVAVDRAIGLGSDDLEILSTTPVTEPALLGMYVQWLPNSDYQRAAGPEFERDGPSFNPHDPASKLSVYIPVVPKA